MTQFASKLGPTQVKKITASTQITPVGHTSYLTWLGINFLNGSNVIIRDGDATGPILIQLRSSWENQTVIFPKPCVFNDGMYIELVVVGGIVFMAGYIA